MGSSERRKRADQQLAQLADLARSCETLFGTPQDIEWAFAQGSLMCPQSRPITVKSLPPIS